MKLTSSLTPFVDLGVRWFTRLAAGPLLLVRLVIGEAFFQAGQGKWAHLERTTSFFEGLGIPFPGANAAFIASLELIGGLALIFGLGTRLFSALLLSTMVVALLTAERAGFLSALLHQGDQGLTDITAFVYLVFLSVLVTQGPGAVSLDRLISRVGRR
jgi:putative oxidoreductase